MNLILAAALSLLVMDGDTFSIDGERIRIANIDAPEISQAKCDAERRLGTLARKRLGELLQKGTVEILRGDPTTGRKVDRHGRTLAVVRVNGQDVGEVLIGELLARPWTGKRRPWCN